MRVVIAFDVSNDRIRYKVVRVLGDYAVRVQRSVFEAPDLNRAAYLRMRSRLERLIDRRTDSLRYYVLCGACVERIHHEGAGPGPLDPPESVEVI